MIHEGYESSSGLKYAVPITFVLHRLHLHSRIELPDQLGDDVEDSAGSDTVDDDTSHGVEQ